jgi:hypothetical protein
MSAIQMILCGALGLAALGFLARALLLRKPASACKLTGLAGAAALCAWMVSGGTAAVGQRVAIVFTEPGDAGPLWQRLREAGMRQATFYRVDESSAGAEEGEVRWHTEPPADAYVEARPAPTLDAAVEAALESLREPPGGWFDRLLFRKRRLVVTVGDRGRWKRWSPVEVEKRLAQARAAGVVVDLVEAEPRPDTATIEVSSDLDLPAYKPLARMPRVLRAVVRGPALRSLAGQPAQASLEIKLNGDAGLALLPAVPETLVAEDGSVEFAVAMKEFGAETQLTPHFAHFDALAELTIGARKIKAAGQSWLPVRTTEVLVACGTGHPEAPLRGGRWVAGGAQPVAPAEVQARLAATLDSLRADTARYEFASVADVQRRLAEGAALPDILVLMELTPTDWARPGFAAGLLARLRGGVHLVVVDPPVLPADAALAKQLSQLLPATSAPGLAGEKDLPRTIDRSAVLVFAFDHNSHWAAPDAPLPGGWDRQLAYARELLQNYKNAGLVTGTLEVVEARPGDPASRVVRYRAAAPNKDRVLVCVAPKLSAPPGDVPAGSTFANNLIPSQIDLRLAALFPHLLGDEELAASGLKREDAPPALKRLLDARPSALPNVAVVVFAARAAPQAAAGPLNGGGQIAYVLDHDESSRRELRQSPAGMVARLLARGIRVAPVLVSITEPEGTPMTFEQGLNALPRRWPRQEPNLFTRFTLRPAAVAGAALTGPLLDAAMEGRPAFERQRAGKGLLPSVGLEALGVASPASSPWTMWKAIHTAPHERGHIAWPVLGRAVDERYALPGPAWAGPRRSRELLLGAGFTDRQRVVHAVCATPAEALPLAEKPAPLLVGGRVGAGHVHVLAWSLLEMPPNDGEWPVRDVVARGDGTEVDRLGPSRLIDIATFVGRTRVTPEEQPSIRAIAAVDARGGLRLEADFLKAHLDKPSVLEPVLRSGDRTATLSLAGFAAAGDSIIYVVGPRELGNLFGPEDQSARIVVEFVPGRPGTVFYARRPLSHSWSELDSLESAATLASLSGGSWLASGEGFALPHIGVRLWAVMALGMLTALAGLWRWRWRRALGRRQQAEAAHLAELAAEGLADDLGARRAARTAARVSEREVVLTRSFQGDGDLEAILRNDMVLYGTGRSSPLRAAHRPVERASYTVIVMNLGRSMRLRLGGEPKCRLAGIVAALVGTAAGRSGSTVRLAVGGTAGGAWQDEAWTGPPGAGEVEALAAAGAGRRATPLGDLEALEVPRGANVFWISDLFEEREPALAERWVRWAAWVASEGGRLAALCIGSDAEATLVGWTGDALNGGGLDRSALVAADLEAKLAEHAALAALLCEQAGAEFVRLHTLMSGAAIVEAFDECEMLG